MTSIVARLSAELAAKPWQVEAAIGLLDGGSTVPFIARYRKEATGALDDTQLRTLEERLSYLRELEERRKAILESIEGQGKLTDALAPRIIEADNKARLEDIYLPYKPKRRTKAQIAMEAGLAPLAETLLGRSPEKDPKTAGRSLRRCRKRISRRRGGARRRARHPGRALRRRRRSASARCARLLVAGRAEIQGARGQGNGGREIFRLFRVLASRSQTSVASHSGAVSRREGGDARP